MKMAAFVVYTLALLLSSAVSAKSSIDEKREGFVVQAKNGNISSAARGLTTLYDQTKDPLVLNDLIAILSWQENSKAIVDACQSCQPRGLSPESVEIVAKAFRNEGYYQTSAKYYRYLTQRSPNNRDAWLGLALSSAEANDLASAKEGLREYRQRFPLDAHFYQNWIYVSQALDDHVGEMFAWQSWLTAEPNNKTAGVGLYTSAVQLGASPAVKSLLTQHPEWFTSADNLWFDYYEASTLLRDGIKAKSVPTIKRSSALLQQVIDKAPADHPLNKSASLDYFYALVTLKDYKTASPLAEQLEKEQPLPRYAQEALGDYYLGTMQPSKAESIFDAIHQKEPKNLPVTIKLYYAYMDTEQYGKAKALIDSEKPNIPKNRWDFTGSTQNVNDEYQTLMQLEALHYAWRGDFPQATETIDKLLTNAPGNPYLLSIKGDIERWKGNTFASERYFEQASQLLSPQDRGITDRGKLMAKLERKDWRGLQKNLDNLNSQYPASDQYIINNYVKKAAAPTWTGEYRRGETDSNGNVLVQASKDWTYDTHLYTGRVLGGYNFFFRDQMSFGEFEENNLYARYSGIGAEIPLSPVTLLVETGVGGHLNDKAYFWTTVDYLINDQWFISGSYKYNSDNTPLRALFDGANVDDFDTYLIYRIKSEINLGLSGKYSDFTDGNERFTYLTWIEGQLYRTDSYTVRGSASYGASFNEEIETASYFNPKSDHSGSLILTQDYHYRINDSWGFDQNLKTGIGSYWQEDFGSDYNWDVSYAQKWIWQKQIDFSYGIGRSKGVYDGEGEYGTYLFANFNVRFPQ
ncbi:poly-beta-1,6 N-acetyl-D-glucosamine export porin PgaA [Photobacterium frigidiphilum]|uniref:Poly-beta-1,6 N-acetyl-D-glucosamine export porin PgaA n=1 Tax=Photobacterium frigidiphilum TaxID=264736 RepID=A0A2T3J923_9GAMM|nr:poly-beta-1,6 N-acetyl-D-glucosamine export porin PgaA [Photobacterium frigidiphilum]PSU45312.1 poly-beta-1,6 N-acetyl-D-glucosamine export porin PgaA [Photobacterium frigidiphilum]